MHKRLLTTFAVITLSTALLIGCGNKQEETTQAETTTETVETTTEPVATEESTPEQETEIPEATGEPTTEIETSEEVATETEPITETANETTTEPVATKEPTPEPEPVPEPQAVYTYTDMSATMYATQTVNVRNLPSTDGEKIGSLSTNQEIAIKAQCNESGWYMFDYSGQTAFVSNNYVSTEKVEVQQTTNSNSGGGGNSLASHFGVTLPFTATTNEYLSGAGCTFLWNSPTSFNADTNFICHLWNGTQVTITDLTGSANDCMAYLTMPDGTSGWAQFSYKGVTDFTW